MTSLSAASRGSTLADASACRTEIGDEAPSQQVMAFVAATVKEVAPELTGTMRFRRAVRNVAWVYEYEIGLECDTLSMGMAVDPYQRAKSTPLPPRISSIIEA
eukprot:Sspe_Gene.7313::Locus_2480_Transcript_1_1_Confidence_1.000_Length_1572::g.7313::m.7313